MNKNDFEINREKLTKKLIKEKNPKKVVELLLYGNEGRNKLTRAQKYDFGLKIEDKLLKQGEIMKKSKQDLINKYEKNFSENNKHISHIPTNLNDILNSKYPENFLDRMEYYKKLKEKSLEELKNDKDYNKKIEDIKNDEEEESVKIVQPKKNNYDSYVKNVFDRLHNEKIQIEKNKKRRNQFINSKTNIEDNKSINDQNQKTNSDNINLNDINENKKEIKKYKNKMTLKELLLSDKIKQIYRNNSVGKINSENEIWPKEMKNNYLSRFKEKGQESPSSISNNKNSSFDEENNDFFN